MKTQYELYYKKINDRVTVTDMYFEIQNSDNPLSEKEIRELILKRPDKYGHLKAFIKGE